MVTMLNFLVRLLEAVPIACVLGFATVLIDDAAEARRKKRMKARRPARRPAVNKDPNNSLE